VRTPIQKLTPRNSVFTNLNLAKEHWQFNTEGGPLDGLPLNLPNQERSLLNRQDKMHA